MKLGGRNLGAFLCLTCGLATLVFAFSAYASGKWPQYGFDARHDLFNPSEHVLAQSNVSELTLQWEYVNGNGTGIAPLGGPALANGTLYVAPYAQTTFTAFDAATGATRWTYQGTSTFSDPAVANGRVYTASLDGYLYAFPADCGDTCAPEWAVPVGALGTNSPPTVSHGNIYIGGYDGMVYAFDAQSGTELWSGKVNPPVQDPLNFAPAVAGGRVYVSGDFGIYAFPGTCTTPCSPLWVARTKFSPAAAPTVTDNSVLVCDYQGDVYAFDAVTGSLQWTGGVTPIPHAIATKEGVAYLTSGDGELVAFAVQGCGQTQCSPLWSSAPTGLTLFQPTIANDLVYVGSLDLFYTQGVLLAYPTNCSEGCIPVATFALGGANETPLVVAGGRVYATTVNGSVDSFGLSP